MPPTHNTSPSADTLRIASIGFYQVMILVTGILVVFADGFDAQIVSYAAPAIGKAWHAASAAFAPVFAANIFGLMIGAMAITPLADSIGRKYVVAVCVAIFGLTSLATIFISEIDVLAVIRFISGLALGGAQPCLIAAVADYFPTRYRTRLAVVLGTAWSLGLTVCGFLTGTMVETAGWQSLFLIGSIMPLVLIPALLLFQPESPHFLIRRGRTRELERILRRIDSSLAAPRVLATRKAAFPVASLFIQGRGPMTALLWIGYFCAGMTLYFLLNWLGLLMKDSGYSPGQSAYVATEYQIGGLIGGILISVLIDRWGARALGAVFVAAGLVVAAMGVSTATITTLSAAAVLAGILVTGGQVAANAYTGSGLYPSEISATGLGWALGWLRLSGVLAGSLAAGWLIGLRLSPAATLRIVAVPEFLTAAAFLGVYRARSLHEQSIQQSDVILAAPVAPVAPSTAAAVESSPDSR